MQDDTLARLDNHWRDRFADFSALIGDGLWETDAAGTVVYLSPPAEAVLRMSGAEGDADLIDRLKSRFAAPAGSNDSFDNVLERLAMHLQRHIPFSALPLDMADGSRILLSGLPVFDPDSGRFSGFRGIIRDISRQRLLEDREAGLRQEAHAFAERRRALYSTLGHELRTPLNSMIGFLECFERELYGPLANPRYRSACSGMLQDARALLERLEIMLHLARGSEDLQAEKAGWRLWPVGELLDGALHLLERERRLPPPRMDEPIPGDLVIECDGGLMQRCFTRLILAMTEAAPAPEPIRIGLDLSAGERGENFALIFRQEGFSHLADGSRHALGGEGSDCLSLAFVREIIASHGGQLRLLPHETGCLQAVCRLPQAQPAG